MEPDTPMKKAMEHSSEDGTAQEWQQRVNEALNALVAQVKSQELKIQMMVRENIKWTTRTQPIANKETPEIYNGTSDVNTVRKWIYKMEMG